MQYPLKALGVDEFHAKFYQSNWKIVGASVFKLVEYVFSEGILDASLNKTSLVLILKKVGVETISQYRPISLCNVLYKIITKTIVIRLRHAMQILVKQNQVSFIASRNIADNIIITQEAVHTMRTTKGKKGWMVVKVDLEKAYDRVRWDFLLETLIDRVSLKC